MELYFFKVIYIIFLFYSYKHKISKKSEEQFYNSSNNKNNIDYIKSLKKVVYTALIGTYDNIQPIVKEEGYDYFLFTDRTSINETTNWTFIKIEQKINYSNIIELIKMQRFFKVLPHLFFQNYDLSIYIDSTFEIKGKLDYFLLRILTPNLSIYILEHPFIDSINNEFEAVLAFKKELKSNVIKIKNRYKY